MYLRILLSFKAFVLEISRKQNNLPMWKKNFFQVALKETEVNKKPNS